MPQPDAKRLQYLACRPIITPANADIQKLANTALFKVGDTVEFFDQDANGCLGPLLGSKTVTSVCTNDAITLDSDIDLTGLSGTAVVCNKTLKNVQIALTRLYECYTQPADQPNLICPSIVSNELDIPVVGQQRIKITEAADCFEPGDVVNVVCDSGLVIAGATVVSVDSSNSKVVIDDNTDLTGETGCKLCNTTLTVGLTFKRIKNSVAAQPVDGELIGNGDCRNTVFKTQNIFVANSSKFYLDGVRMTRGSAGTRAALTVGAGDAAMTFTAMTLETLGNSTQINLNDPAANSSPLSVAVTGDFPDFVVEVSLGTDVGGAIDSTAKQVVDAINADLVAQRVVQAQYGGTGADPVSAIAATNLAGALDDSTGDYSEIEQATNNLISGTGYKYAVVRVDPDDNNRFDVPPDDTEELVIDYRRAN